MNTTKIFMAALAVLFIAAAIFLCCKLSPGGKRAKKPSHKQWIGYSSAASATVVLSVFVALYVVYAIVAAPSDAGLLVLPSPYKERWEAYVEIADGYLLHLSDDFYVDDSTPATACSKQVNAIHQLLEEHRTTGELFELPHDFEIKGVDPIDISEPVDSLEGYDGHLKSLFQVLEENDEESDEESDKMAEIYHLIGTTAWSCLDALGKAAELSDCLYYAQIAFYGFGNEYVLGELEDGAKVDLLYGIAQVYVHIGDYATTSAPPFRYEMYFVAAAFADLSYFTLKNMDFDGTGHEYRSAVWELNMNILYRLGLHMDDHDGYFKLLTGCSDEVLLLAELTNAEKKVVDDYVKNVDDWGINS